MRTASPSTRWSTIVSFHRCRRRAIFLSLAPVLRKGLHAPRRLTTAAEPTDQYLSNFSWNKIRYRADKPLSELIDTLQKVRRCLCHTLAGVGHDGNTELTQYTDLGARQC